MPTNSESDTITPEDPRWEGLPPIPESELPDWALGAKRAMERATEKEFDRKRKMGYKIVIWKDHKVQVVDPPPAPDSKD